MVTTQTSLRSVQKRAVKSLAFGSPHLADQVIGVPRQPFFAVSGDAGHPSEQLHLMKFLTSLRLGVFLCLGCLGCLVAAEPKKETKPIIPPAQLASFLKNANGDFDMTKNPRPFIGFLILDQVGNKFPSFWCGGNVAGKINFECTPDPFEPTIPLKQKGSFSCQLVGTGRKIGMWDTIPAGVFAADLKTKPFKINFDTFTNPTFKKVTEKKSYLSDVNSLGGRFVEIDVTCSGSVSIGDTKAPFAGTAVLGFLDSATAFTLQAKFPFPGKELGLPGAKGEGITATFWTQSVISTNAPKISDVELP